jgi:hypothetical protein
LRVSRYKRPVSETDPFVIQPLITLSDTVIDLRNDRASSDQRDGQPLPGKPGA